MNSNNKKVNEKPLVVIFGRTNVGKSTLFNCLTEKHKALVSSIEGTTRDSNIGEVEWQGKSFALIDTGGIIDIKFLADKKIKDSDIDACEHPLAGLPGCGLTQTCRRIELEHAFVETPVEDAAQEHHCAVGSRRALGFQCAQSHRRLLLRSGRFDHLLRQADGRQRTRVRWPSLAFDLESHRRKQ